MPRLPTHAVAITCESFRMLGWMGWGGTRLGLRSQFWGSGHDLGVRGPCRRASAWSSKALEPRSLDNADTMDRHTSGIALPASGCSQSLPGHSNGA